VRRPLVVHRRRPARQHNPHWRVAADFFQTGIERENNREDLVFADAARNQLRILRPEVEDDDGIGFPRINVSNPTESVKRLEPPVGGEPQFARSNRAAVTEVAKVDPEGADDPGRAVLRPRRCCRICTMKKQYFLWKTAKSRNWPARRFFQSGLSRAAGWRRRGSARFGPGKRSRSGPVESNATGVGGEEVLYALKRDARTEQIPVIVVSHLPPANFANLKVAGAAEYFHKLRFLEDAKEKPPSSV